MPAHKRGWLLLSNEAGDWSAPAFARLHTRALDLFRVESEPHSQFELQHSDAGEFEHPHHRNCFVVTFSSLDNAPRLLLSADSELERAEWLRAFANATQGSSSLNPMVSRSVPQAWTDPSSEGPHRHSISEKVTASDPEVLCEGFLERKNETAAVSHPWRRHFARVFVDGTLVLHTFKVDRSMHLAGCQLVLPEPTTASAPDEEADPAQRRFSIVPHRLALELRLAVPPHVPDEPLVEHGTVVHLGVRNDDQREQWASAMAAAVMKADLVAEMETPRGVPPSLFKALAPGIAMAKMAAQAGAAAGAAATKAAAGAAAAAADKAADKAAARDARAGEALAKSQAAAGRARAAGARALAAARTSRDALVGAARSAREAARRTKVRLTPRQNDMLPRNGPSKRQRTKAAIKARVMPKKGKGQPKGVPPGMTKHEAAMGRQAFVGADSMIRFRFHDKRAEFERVHELDLLGTHPGQRVFAVSTAWTKAWLRFVAGMHQQPGPIFNACLLTKSRNVRKGLRLQTDFRIFNLETYSYLLGLYAGGPTIFVDVPETHASASEYLESVDLSYVGMVGSEADLEHPESLLKAVDETRAETSALLAAGLLAGAEARDKMREAMAMQGEINQAAADAIGASLAGDLAKKKMQEAMAMDGEINQAAADAIGAQLAGDLGRKKMEEAKRLEEQAKLESAGALAQSMAGDAARAQMAKAREVEQQEKEAAAAALANSMAGDAARAEMARAREMEAEAQQEAAGAMANMFAGDAAKRKMAEAKEQHAAELQAAAAENMAANFKAARGAAAMREAIAAGDDEAALEAAAAMVQGAYRALLARRRVAEARRVKEEQQLNAAARMLQSAYRSHQARKRAAAIREEKERAQLNAAARMLQSAYRTHQARAKANKLRAEKEEMRLNAAARMVQCAWRAKKAREKVQRLKAEREAKAQEGACIMVQAAWRRKQARERVNKLKAEKEALMMEAAATMFQCAWRKRKARQKVEALKAEKERMMMEAAAVMLQTAWRCKTARERVNGLRESRDQNAGASKMQALFRGKQARKEFAAQKISAVRLQAVIRKFRARKEVERLARPAVRPMLVRLVSAAGLRVADRTASDPFVLLSSMVGADQISICKSETIKDTVDPVWNQELVLLSPGDARLVLTVCDWDRFGRNDFLGQAVLDLAQHPGAWINGGAFTLDLGNYEIHPLQQQGGSEVGLGDADEAGQGTITFEIVPLPRQRTMCGQLGRLSEAKLRNKGFKQRTLVLLPDALLYFEADGNMREEKGRLAAAAFTGVSIADDGNIHVANSAGKDWVMQPPADNKARVEWLYKLRQAGGLPQE